MPIGLRLLPKGVDFGPARFLNDGGEARGLDLEQLHSERVSIGAKRKKKSARELRQGGSDYRCCIPALAGFVSPQSIVPDGTRLFPKDRERATGFDLVALQG